MPRNNCTVVEDGVPCPRPHKARGWCKLHYERWKRTGDPLTVTTHPISCSVIEDGIPCPNKHIAHGFCDKHRRRWLKHGDPLYIREISTTYGAIHDKINAKRGKASQHVCVICGKQAQSWACVRNKTHTDKTGHGYTVNYSINIDDYEPMCWTNHRNLDSIAIRGEQQYGSKLSEEIVRELRRRYDTGERLPYAELAKQYGVTRGHIWKVATRRKWGWLT